MGGEEKGRSSSTMDTRSWVEILKSFSEGVIDRSWVRMDCIVWCSGGVVFGWVTGLVSWEGAGKRGGSIIPLLGLSLARINFWGVVTGLGDAVLG